MSDDDLPDVATDGDSVEGTDADTDTADASDADAGATDADPADGEFLGDVASRVRERRRNPNDDATLDELFEAVDVGEVDSDALWNQVQSDGPAVEAAAEARDHVLDKAKYCQKCEYFSGPPAVTCTYEGADVLEVVDTEHFRVRNCPVVAEEEDLETIND